MVYAKKVTIALKKETDKHCVNGTPFDLEITTDYNMWSVWTTGSEGVLKHRLEKNKIGEYRYVYRDSPMFSISFHPLVVGQYAITISE